MNTCLLLSVAAFGFVLACFFASVAGGSHTNIGRRRSWIVCIVSFVLSSVPTWMLFVRAGMFRINQENPEHSGLFIWLGMLVIMGTLWRLSDERNHVRHGKRCVP